MNLPAFITSSARCLSPRVTAVATALVAVALPAAGQLFGPAQTIRSGQSPAAWVQAADVDRNGLGDVVYSPSAGKLDVLLRQPGGTWTTVPLVTSGVLAVLNAVVADFDGDGLPDVAAYVQKTSTDSGVHLVRQTAAGVFDTAAPTYFKLGATPAANGPMRVADIDRDGKLDLALAWKVSTAGSNAGRAGWLRGTGNGAFTSLAPFFLRTFDNPTDVEVGDFDRDGDVDIAVADADLFVHAGPDFGSQSVVDLSRSAVRMRAVDQNRDGWLDLMVSHAPPVGTLVVYRGGPGGFTIPAGADFSAMLMGTNAGLVTGDLDLDGRSDAVCNATALFDRGGVAAAPVPLPGFPAPSGAVALCDDDADGDLDVICGSATGVVRIPNLLPHRSLNRAVTTADGPAGSAATGATAATTFATGDFNRDGRADVASVTSSTGDVRVLLNSNGTSVTSTVIGNIPSCRHLISADLDGDGDTDLAAPSITTGRIVWFANNGTGSSWTLNVIPYAVNTPFGLACGDVNLDGRPDLVTNSVTGGALHLLAGGANGTFTGSTLVSFASVNQIEIADVVPGGRPEIVLRHGSQGAVALLRHGAGGWTQSSVLPAGLLGGGGEGLAVTDLDGNGLDDVVAGFSWWVYHSLQTAPGTFSAPAVMDGLTFVPAGTLGTVRSLRAADLNLDGRPEIVAAMQDGVAVLSPILPGRPVIDPVVVVRESAEPQTDVAVACLDGDVVPELWHHAASGNRIAISRVPAPVVTLSPSPAWTHAGAMNYPLQQYAGAALLKMGATHHGWPGDAPVALSQLRITLVQDNAARTPLTAELVNYSFTDFSLWRDEVNPLVLDAGTGDTFLASAPVGVPDAAGSLVIQFGTSARLVAGQERQIFLGAMTGATIANYAFRLEMQAGTLAGCLVPNDGNSVTFPVAGLVSSSTAARFKSGPPTIRQSWRSYWFKTPHDIGLAADMADPDGDGLVNLLEYAFDLDPTAPDSIRSQVEAQGNGFYFSFWPDVYSFDVGLTVLASPDLRSWSPVATRNLAGQWTETVGDVFPGNSDGDLLQQIYYTPRKPGSPEWFRLEAQSLAP